MEQISNFEQNFHGDIVVWRKCGENAFRVQLDELDPADFGDSGNGIIIPDFKTSRVQKCRVHRTVHRMRDTLCALCFLSQCERHRGVRSHHESHIRKPDESLTYL